MLDAAFLQIPLVVYACTPLATVKSKFDIRGIQAVNAAASFDIVTSKDQYTERSTEQPETWMRVPVF